MTTGTLTGGHLLTESGIDSHASAVSARRHRPQHLALVAMQLAKLDSDRLDSGSDDVLLGVEQIATVALSEFPFFYDLQEYNTDEGGADADVFNSLAAINACAIAAILAADGRLRDLLPDIPHVDAASYAWATSVIIRRLEDARR